APESPLPFRSPQRCCGTLPPRAARTATRQSPPAPPWPRASDAPSMDPGSARPDQTAGRPLGGRNTALGTTPARKQSARCAWQPPEFAPLLLPDFRPDPESISSGSGQSETSRYSFALLFIVGKKYRPESY